jgi:hypothetical protein
MEFNLESEWDGGNGVFRVNGEEVSAVAFELFEKLEQDLKHVTRNWDIEACARHAYQDRVEQLEQQNKELVEDNEFLSEEVWGMLLHNCSDGSTVDSMCMSAYTLVIDYFIKKGRLKEVSRCGRRIIAKIVEDEPKEIKGE